MEKNVRAKQLFAQIFSIIFFCFSLAAGTFFLVTTQHIFFKIIGGIMVVSGIAIVIFSLMLKKVGRTDVIDDILYVLREKKEDLQTTPAYTEEKMDLEETVHNLSFILEEKQKAFEKRDRNQDSKISKMKKIILEQNKRLIAKEKS